MVTKLQLLTARRNLMPLVIAEGLKVARNVREGKFTKEDVEDAYVSTGDGEPLIALAILESWEQQEEQ